MNQVKSKQLLDYFLEIKLICDIKQSKLKSQNICKSWIALAAKNSKTTLLQKNLSFLQEEKQ